MKKQTSCITYLAAAVIGIILLCMHDKELLSKGLVVAMGVLITIPSAMMLINSFVGRKNEDGVRSYPAWYTIIVACAGLVLGIWMLCMPTFFEMVTVYTLGVGLILVGVAGIVFIANASRPYGANWAWYCVPILLVTGGFLVCFIAGGSVGETWPVIVTGILLIVYALNGVASLGRERKLEKDIKILEDSAAASRDEDPDEADL